MSKPMLDGHLMFPTQYLASEEFLDKDVTLTIKDVKIDNLQMSDGGTEDKPVLLFDKTNKKLVLNKTNATTIAKLHGSEAREWVGKSITLFPTECQAFGKTVDCIRIRSKAPKSKPAPAPASGPGEETDTGTDSAMPESESAPGSVPGANLKLIRDILGKDAVTKDGVNKVGMLTGMDGEEPVQKLIEAGEFRAAVEMMAELFGGE